MYIHAGRFAFAWPYVGIHRSTSLMSSSLLLQQCLACLVRLTWIVFVIGGRWPYSWCLVGCCRQDLFKIARSTYTYIQHCVNIYIYKYIDKHVYTNKTLYIYIYIYIYTHTHTNIQHYIYIYTYTYTLIYYTIYIHTYIYIYICKFH